MRTFETKLALSKQGLKSKSEKLNTKKIIRKKTNKQSIL